MRKITGFLLLLLYTIAAAQNQNDTVLKIWTLEDCLVYAVENNITVQKAKLSKNSAELNAKQSRNNLLPSLSASASQSIANGNSIDPITSNFESQLINSSSFGINSSFTLYNGGRLRRQVEQNRLIVDQNDLYLKAAENNIILSVVESYVQALYYQESIAIAENSVTSSREEVKRAAIRYEEGAIAYKELVDVEAQLAQNQYAVVTAQNQYALQVLALKQLLELDPLVEFQIEIPDLDKIGEYMLPDKTEVYALALQSLPDVKVYDVIKNTVEKDLEIAKAGFLPTVSLSAGINTGYTSSQQLDYFNQLNGNMSEQVSLSLSIPIFSKFANKTNVELAKVELQQNELDKISASKELYRNIETAWLNASANQSELEASANARETSRLAYELSQKKYEFGALTTTELLVSQNSYINAENQYIQTKYMGVLYYQLLQFYQGKPIKISE